MKKLDWVLLVDDDADCNFFHQRIINRMDCVEKVFVASDGQDALEFLQYRLDWKPPGSAIIFLDLNMPRLNGWEFMEEFVKIKDKIKTNIVVILLTSSFNPDDREQASTCNSLDGFRSKSLTKDMFNQILDKHFPELQQQPCV
jgi:CheY-like chemotaxis protein